VKLYGIANCDTVKKARAWLDAEGIACEFVDFRKVPPTAADLERWCAAVGCDALLNRRGRTWHSLATAEQAGAADTAGALALMRARPTLIKRPVVEDARGVVVGFAADAWRQRFRG
jgi:Spx/MgsR family transcriptional regulator